MNSWFQAITKLILRWIYQHSLKITNQALKKKFFLWLLWWRQYLYSSGGRVLEIARFDENLRLWVNICELEGGNLYFGLTPEGYELTIVKELVQRGDVIFDVGANIGTYSLVTSRLVGKNGIVYAFEPAQFTYDILLKNIMLNQVSNVVANKIAVGERTGEVDLFVNEQSGLTSLGQTRRGKIITTEKVQSILLDDYVKQHQISQINLLKVDVEGYEGHVLRGAKHLIEQEKDLVILCELAEKNFKPLGLSVNEVINWMRKRGYEVWEIDRQKQRLIRLDENRPSYKNQNFIFVRPGTKRQRRIVEISQSEFVE